MKRSYFDYSATTPVGKEVLAAMMPYFSKKFGNASSLHSFGQDASSAVENSRMAIAEYLNCEPSEIIFTSGATEANNLAILGTVRSIMGKEKNKIHIITTKIEHDSVLEPFRQLEKEGVEVTYLPVDKRGIIKIEDLRSSIKDNTRLVSIMYVNSEIGSVQPIKQVGRLISDINEKRFWNWNNADKKTRKEKPDPIRFHTDAVQALNYFACDVKALKADMLSFSGHKIYGPKGIGALYVKKGLEPLPMVYGGHHERNLRSGTLNVPAIVGLAKAIYILKRDKDKSIKKISSLRKILVERIGKKIPNSILNTDLDNATPSHAHFTFPGAEGESILIALDLAGIAVSTGSACASGSLEPSHVLLAMGIKKEVCHASIRFTLGKFNEKEDIQKLISVLPGIISKIRAMAPKLDQ